MYGFMNLYKYIFYFMYGCVARNLRLHRYILIIDLHEINKVRSYLYVCTHTWLDECMRYQCMT